MPYNRLSEDEENIIENKDTELPFSGEYDDFYQPGTFICRRCNSPLFSSKSKFDAHCGWPSFDDTFKDAVKRLPDDDTVRTEIQCAHCGAHLGHVFEGEGFTPKSIRHCVNSLSIRFIPQGEELPSILTS